MNDETPLAEVDAAKVIWQRQKKEHSTMSLEEVRIRAYVLRERVRHNLIVAFILGGLVIGLSASVAVKFAPLSMRIVSGAILALTVFAIYNAYSRVWLRPAPPFDAAIAGCVSFYRRELEAQHRSLQLTWRLLVPVLVFAFITRHAVLQSIPVNARILIPALLLLVMFERRREARKINRKLRALDGFESDRS